MFEERSVVGGEGKKWEVKRREEREERNVTSIRFLLKRGVHAIIDSRHLLYELYLIDE